MYQVAFSGNALFQMGAFPSAAYHATLLKITQSANVQPLVADGKNQIHA